MKQGEKMLKKLTQQATDLILHSIASGEVMGANLLITKGNEELVYAQAGRADREAEKPIERNTIFRLYSMTKPITAVAAMILMERGMLDLYEPVADILPAFAHQKVERDGKLYTPERPILMHDLLAMTSGLVYPEEQTMGGRAVTKVFEEACARLESDHPVSTQEMASTQIPITRLDTADDPIALYIFSFIKTNLLKLTKFNILIHSYFNTTSVDIATWICYS